MRWPGRVEIVEVGPRDGLQSLAPVVPTELKLRIIDELISAGLRRIEVTSFARADVVPQLADAEALVARLPMLGDVRYRALVPNLYGARRAIDAGMQEVCVLMTASETYNRLNQNMTIAESMRVVDQVAELALASGVHVVAAVGLAIFCPYEGEIPR